MYLVPLIPLWPPTSLQLIENKPLIRIIISASSVAEFPMKQYEAVVKVMEQNGG